MIITAEIWPNEGLDLVIKNAGFNASGSTPANTFLALFTTFTASTVGNSASVTASYSEPTGGAYARQTIAAGSWGAIGSTTSGRISTCAQISFVQATGSYSAAVNGFYCTNSLTGGAGNTYFAANFDDTTAVNNGPRIGASFSDADGYMLGTPVYPAVREELCLSA